MNRLLTCLLLVAVIGLSGCDDNKQKADRHFQSGLALLNEGDVERALVEFKNVVTLDPNHEAGRLSFARSLELRGQKSHAMAQYLRLIERNPEHLLGRVRLADMAIRSEDWELAETHGRRAGEILAKSDLSSDDPVAEQVGVVLAMLDYRVAMLANDLEAAEGPVAVARSLLEETPEDHIAREIVIDHEIRSQNLDAALALAEAGLKLNPMQSDLHDIRLGLLHSKQDLEGVRRALEEMAELFPDNLQIRDMLITLYADMDDLPAVETYLRELSDDPEATLEHKTTIVEFLRQTQGLDAAKAELERRIALEEDGSTFRALRASILFEQGERQNAIHEMETVVSGVEPSDEKRDFQIILARMLDANGNDAQHQRAMELVEQILSEDPGHVEALRLRAQWTLAENKPDEAVLLLRQALTQEPRDLGVISLLGEAHEQAGDTELAGERYALAVDLSGQNAEESLKYADFLVRSNRLSSAEAVMTNAIVRDARNVELQTKMAEIKLALGEFEWVDGIVRKLRAFDDEVAQSAANEIELELLRRQERYGETSELLSQMIRQGEESNVTKARLVDAMVRAGKLDEARVFIEEERAKAPDDRSLRYLGAGLSVLAKDYDQAEQLYDGLLQENPADTQALRALYALYSAADRMEDADALIERSIAAVPEALLPRVLLAGRLEQKQDYDGAINVYTELYELDSGNLVVVNNLASALATYRDDELSLAKAAQVASALRGVEEPVFQDTLGWIAYRRGNHSDALFYLQAAVQGLPDDPIAQYHLGKTYLALERRAQAAAAFAKAIELGGEDQKTELKEARQLLKDLQG